MENDPLLRNLYGSSEVGVTSHAQSQQTTPITPARAVGQANGSNPLTILIPCHRVVGKNGTLTGYGGGIERKQGLLDLESRFSWE